MLHLWCFYWFQGLQISRAFPLPSPLLVVVHGVPPAYLLLLLNAGGSSRTRTAAQRHLWAVTLSQKHTRWERSWRGGSGTAASWRGWSWRRWWSCGQLVDHSLRRKMMLKWLRLGGHWLLRQLSQNCSCDSMQPNTSSWHGSGQQLAKQVFRLLSAPLCLYRDRICRHSMSHQLKEFEWLQRRKPKCWVYSQVLDH